MLIYEKEWANQRSRFLSYTVENLNWHLHFHAAFEICLILKGIVEITIDNAMYTLKKGEAVIIFPRQLHAYKTIEGSDIRMITFIPELVPEFTKNYQKKIPADNTIRGLLEYETLFDANNIFLQKGLLYAVLGRLVSDTDFKEAQADEDAVLLDKALRYIEENYNADCTLRSASKKLSYSYSYLSRSFKRLMGMSFTEYLNRFRINRAVYLLRTESGIPVSQIAQLCGFESLCNFNRNFKLITGTTPRKMLADI